MDAELSPREFQLLNSFQRGFPLKPRPFAAIGTQLGMREQEVIDTLQRWQDSGVVSRVGAVFRPNAIGASALAALAVPVKRIDTVAKIVNGFAEVNHNYEREHRFNLWFVVAAPSSQRLHEVLAAIEKACACGPVLVLPMLEDYHIDLGFDLANGAGTAPLHGPIWKLTPAHPSFTLDASEQEVLAALQDGLPIVERPFACLGVPEEEAIAIITRWLDDGLVKRFGVVVRHHELGYGANAMVVWDVPESDVGRVGRRIAASGRVTLCYRRERRMPEWRYNLFCMIHGKDRADVEARIADLIAACDMNEYPHDVLFSRRRFKQRGARYAPVTGAVHG
ncbi:MAG TPA: Lrp/AsnC family transcriptional regulator [Noviherbaspirillum sp.]